MVKFLKALLLLQGLGCRAISSDYPSMSSGFDNIEPSADLIWTPCFQNFTCSRLEVPLDYSNKSIGTTSVPFIKLAGKNATAGSQSIVLIPGGPGGSGVDLLLTYQAVVSQFLGEQYNIVSFDPRGVNNGDLSLDCFSGNSEARLAFNRLYNTGVVNISSTSLEEQYYSSSIYGEWCNNAAKNESHGYYVTTPAVAHDLVSFIEAEAKAAGQSPSDAKLWCYGVSYGTVVGATFASMFPSRVGRMVLDGLVNSEQYYDNNERDNVDQMDEAIAEFLSFCHSAGPEKCSFWGPTTKNITARLDAIISQLQNHPVPISGVQSQELPALVTYSDLKALLIVTLYTPVASFPTMADSLHQLEHGDASVIAGLSDQLSITADGGNIIHCVDSYRRNKISTIDEFKSYIEYTVSQSKYTGDIWPILAAPLLCRSFQPNLPDDMVVQGPITGIGKNVSFPILFTSNTVDPITALKTARTMSAQFPGSVLLTQEAVGHTVVLQGGSNCYFGHVQAYFQGVVPPSNITCPRQYTPFIDSPVLS